MFKLVFVDTSSDTRATGLEVWKSYRLLHKRHIGQAPNALHHHPLVVSRQVSQGLGRCWDAEVGVEV